MLSNPFGDEVKWICIALVVGLMLLRLEIPCHSVNVIILVNSLILAYV